MSNQKTKIIIETDAGRSEQVLRSVQKGLSGVGNEADKAGKSVKSGTDLIAAAFSKTVMSAAGLGLGIKTAFSMAKEASKLSEARLYLQTFASEMGVSYQKLDEATRKTTDGLVDNLTLIRMNHKALKLGISTDVNEIGRLWQIANSIGDEFGESIESTFDRIVNAISKGSKEELIQLGLLPPALKQAANATELLSNRSLLLKSVLQQTSAGVDSLGGHGTTAADKFIQLDVAVKNLKNSFGESLIPIFTPIVEGLTAILNLTGKVIEKLAEIDPLLVRLGKLGPNTKHPLLGKNLEELKILREATESRATSLEFDLESLSRPASQGGKAGMYTEGQRQHLAIQLAGEKQMLKEIDKFIGNLETRTKARAEAQKTVVAETKNEKVAKKELEDAEKRLAKAIEATEKAAEEVATAFLNGFGIKTVGNLKEAQDLLVGMTAAAGGFAVGLKNGTTEAGKMHLEISKLHKATEEFNQNFLSMITNGGYNAAEDLRRLSPDTAMMGMMNFMSGGMLTANGAKDAIKDIKEPLSKTIAEAVQAGFANADFSNLSLTLGSILSDVISKSVAQSNPVISSTGGINWGNLGTNIAVNWAVGRLTGAGGLFGKRKENGKEAVQQAATLREQMGQTYLKSYETQNLAYLYGNGGSGYLNALNSGRNAYFGTYVGYNWNDSGDGIFSKKTRTYELVDQGASSALKKLTEAIERAEKFNRNVERGYELMIAEGNDFKALVEQALVYQNAAAYAIGGERSLNWTDGSRDTADLAESAHDIKVAAAELARQLGQAKAERSTSIAQGFAKYAPWLSMMQLPNAVTTTSGLGGYNPMIPGGGHVRMISSYPIVDMNTLGVGEQYDAFSALQEKFMDREISPYMIEMIKQSGSSMFGLEKLKFSDPDSYSEKYLEYVEKQISAFDEIMKRQEQIFQDAARTYEERSAALQTFERAQESYYQAKLDTLAAEQAAEEAVKRKQQEADLRRMETMEAALSLTGEIAQRGDKIIVIQGGDTSKAVRELLGRYSDDPEMTSILQGLLKIADDKARWGK